MEKQKKVIDASVLFKWFSAEEDSDKAIQIKEEHLSRVIDFIIPLLAIIEVINALRYKEKDENKVREANKLLQEIQLNTKPLTKELMNKAIENAYKYDITIYDSIYVSLAELNNCQLITADKELFKIRGGNST